jgi:indole-3-glycerol phosphate synthase
VTLTDFLDTLAKESIERADKGYYNVETHVNRKPVNLVKAIKNCKHIPIVAEIKQRSPSLGSIRDEIDPVEISHALRDGGAVGISVITEPNRFEGSLQLLRKVRETVDLPILMKDFVTREAHVEAASRLGADALLLINELFERGYCIQPLHDMIDLVHSRGLEVLLEAHNAEEFQRALDTDADIVGINNRDLRDLSVNLETAHRILEKYTPHDKIVIVESGIRDRNDLNCFLKLGADAFLIGSSLMKTKDIENKLKEFTTIHENC